MFVGIFGDLIHFFVPRNMISQFLDLPKLIFFSGNNLPGHHRFHPPCSFRFVDGVEVRKICGYPCHQPDYIGVYFEHFVDAIDWEKVYVDGIYVKRFVDGIDVSGFVDGVEVKKICGRNKSIGLTIIKWTEPK